MTQYDLRVPEHLIAQGDFREPIKTLYPDRTDGPKAATHSKPFRSENGAVISVVGYQCAPEATPRPRGVKVPHTIPQEFERINEDQMHDDAWREWTPLQLILAWAALCLLTLLVASYAMPILFEVIREATK